MNLFYQNNYLSSSSPLLKGQTLCLFLQELDQRDIEEMKGKEFINKSFFIKTIAKVIAVGILSFSFFFRAHKGFYFVYAALVSLGTWTYFREDSSNSKEASLLKLKEIASLRGKIHAINEKLKANPTEIEQYQLPRARVFLEFQKFKLEDKYFKTPIFF